MYGLTIELLPLPLTGFLATAILNLSLWMKDDVASGTPRAFVYLTLALFLYGVVRRSWWWAAIAIGLTASFYPQYVIVEGTIAFIGAGVTAYPGLARRLGLARTSPERGANREMNRQAVNTVNAITGSIVRFWLSLWAVAIVAVLGYALTSGDYGETISLEQARHAAEFWPRGRSQFFNDDWVRFWLTGERSGFFPDRLPLFPWLGLLLPLTVQFPRIFPLVAAIDPRSILLRWWFLSTVSLFGLAHLLLFRLHLPSRYAHHNLKLLLAITSAIAITLWVDGLWRWAQRRVGPKRRSLAMMGIVRRVVGRLLRGAMILSVAASPLWLADAFHPAYQTGGAPEIYAFLRSTPIDTTIAGIDGEMNNLPSFSQRSIIFGFEYAIPYQLGYYLPLKQRGVETIATFFSGDRQQVANFVDRYNLGLWLVRRSSFQADAIRQDKRLGELVKSDFQADPMIHAIATAIADLEAGRVPVLAADLDRCAVFSHADLVILDAACTATAPKT
ncbi:MAG: hypothetical protein EAZ61_06350 [Oscillatoriales cyanobacterium]|nr:MAG: hypothetical protein EAZ61_06350 [Oscillatoriales cyanobacterium]